MLAVPADRPLVAFLYSSFPSHLLGSMGLARQLRQLGCDVEYWCEEGVRRLVLAQDFVHRSVPDVWWSYERVMPGGWRQALHDPRQALCALSALRERRRDLPSGLRRFEQSVDTHLSRRVPHLVVLDPFVVAYYPLLRVRQVPCVLLQDKPLCIADPLVPPPTSSFIPEDTHFGRLRVRAAWIRERVRGAVNKQRERWWTAAGRYTPADLVEAVRARAGAPTQVKFFRRLPYDGYFEDLREWALATPLTDFRRESPLPPRTRYIGPWVDLERREGPAPVFADQGGRRLVYVSMGATIPHWQRDVGLLERILRVLSDDPQLYTVMATGSVRARAELNKAMPAAFVVRWLPQLALLRRAELVVTHAGANALRECIALGTPLVALPREYDQLGNAARAVYLGVGVQARRRSATGSGVLRKVLHVLGEPRYRERARALGLQVEALQARLLREALRGEDLIPEERLTG